MAVRTRFAPSPTGLLHVGSVRTALFNFLFARRSVGGFILRMEDTDRRRSTPEFEEAIMEDLAWLGLCWDEGPDTGGDRGPYRQSERLSVYLEYAARLLKAGRAYRCYCTVERLEALRRSQLEQGLPPRYDGRCRNLRPDAVPEGASHVVRFMVEDGKVEFEDMVFGPMRFDARDIGDFIIVGSDRIATYNFAAVVDDALMGVTHVIRGEDHLPNTPRQILLFRALGFGVPGFMHLPLVLSEDRTPLGKRHAGLSIRALREEGYLPDAVLNAVAHLGGYPGWSGEEFLSLDEMVRRFSVKRLSRSPSVFDVNALKRMGRAAMERASAEAVAGLVSRYFKDADRARLERAVREVKGEASTLEELRSLLVPLLEESEPTEKAREVLARPYVPGLLRALRDAVEGVEELDGENSRKIMKGLKRPGLKDREVFMPVRAAVTGSLQGVELNKVLAILGKEEVLRRLERFTGT